MAKYELDKLVEAQKLNKRTGIPLAERPVTIPYGAIVDELEESGDHYKFTYLTDRYVIRKDVISGAFHPMGGGSEMPPPPEAAPAPAPVAAAAVAAAPDRPQLVFEGMSVRGPVGLSRARVPGGWLVASAGGSVAFVPDPSHRWDGGSV